MAKEDQDPEIDKLIDALQSDLREFDNRVMATAWQMKRMLRLFELLNAKVKALESNK